MSEITQPPPDIQSQDTNARVNRINAASDQNTSNKQSTEQNTPKERSDSEPEKLVTHHDPAVTLASTLAKLDSGSFFTATVHGTDGDGRTVITSEIGTYLVQLDDQKATNLKVGELDKIAKNSVIEIRVLTIDKEIKAEIIRTNINDKATPKKNIIPVILTLTELSKHLDHLPQNTLQTKTNSETPLEDIKSQYQATKLYKAEQIAREIANKLDNLPLPTSSPNYTVYGSSLSQSGENTNAGLRRISANVSIQEVVRTQPNQIATQTQLDPNTINQLLGKNINVQVIKTFEKSHTPLPAGLPASVVKEITALTPLDYVIVGQNLNINISAIAIPEIAIAGKDKLDNSKISQTSNQTETAAHAISTTPTKNTQAKDNIASNPSQPNINDTILSGIVIDNAQNSKQTNKQLASSAPKVKNYYLATSTSVLKFSNNTPLIPGTIVSFTVLANPNSPEMSSAEANPGKQKINNLEQALTAATLTASNAQPNNHSTIVDRQLTEPNNTISTELIRKIETSVPQSLDQIAEDWASINQALSALTSTAMSAASILTSRIPNMQNPEQFTSSMFFFLSALKASQPAKIWLGPVVSAKLKQIGAGKVINRMNQDFSRIARIGAEIPAGEWRPILIPFQNGSEISAIPMLTKHVGDEDEQKKGQESSEDKDDINVKTTRFILEVNFSQFGTLLIDGLLKGSRFDVILKSVNPIPIALKLKLSEHYKKALIKNNFEGEMIIIDNKPTEVSVQKIIDSIVHKMSVEKKI